MQEGARYEIRLAGSGGQGIVLAGILLAEAALHEGRYAAHTQNYGPETRGGISVSDVILSNSEIDYPEALAPDILVALTQEALQRHAGKVKEGGVVIVESALSHAGLGVKVASLPLAQTAREAGEPRAINMAALAAVAVFCPYVSPGSLTAVIEERLPAAKTTINLSVFNKMLKEARALKGQLQPVETRDDVEI